MAGEKNFENKVKAELKRRGAWHVKYWGGGEFTKAGIPDILACYEGRFMGIEVKGERGRPSPLQLRNLAMIDDAGGFGLLLYPKDWETFIDLLDAVEVVPNLSTVNIVPYQRLKARWWDKWQGMRA